jgi:hypothetical protein
MSEYTSRSDHHTTRAFDSDLQEIARKVAAMGGLAEKQITDAIRALRDRDTELAEQVIATDPTIDAMQHEIEQKAVLTIAAATADGGGFARDHRRQCTALSAIGAWHCPRCSWNCRRQ